MRKFSDPAENLAKSAAEYIDLKTDDVKLRTARGLAVVSNKILFAVLMLSVANIILLAVAFGCVLLVGEALGSWWGGAFIVAGFFLVVMLALFLLRNKLFLNGFVRMFINLFFDE